MAALPSPIQLVNERFVQATPRTYQGFPVLDMRVGAAIPVPRIPERYAVRVYPDLARYWLDECNHPNQRSVREAKVRVFAPDMVDGEWPLTPESLVFSDKAKLINGQNRLMSVTQAGEAVWFLVEFGWPDKLINYFDRGTARTNSDALRVDGVANYNQVAAAINSTSKYEATVGTATRWSAIAALSASRQRRAYETEPDAWQAAALLAQAIYRMHKAYSTTAWATAYMVIAHERGDESAVRDWFDEIVNESGAPDAPSRRLVRKFARVKVSETESGDSREPYENIVRAFNAHRMGKRLAFVRQPRFTLTRPTTK
jgi:hypothetical protein